MYVLAVDGGASSTRALIGTTDGAILAIGRGGPSNHLYGEGAKRRLERALRTSIDEAVAQLDTSIDQFESCWLGMTGVSEESQDAPLVEACLRPLVSWRRIGVSGDMLTALVGASVRRPGIIVYAGTGSVAYGIDAAGDTAKVGGWGSLIDDEGGGYQIGRAALKAVFRAADGRTKPTTLTEALLNHFRTPSLSELRHRVYLNDGLERPEVAELTRLVGQTALDGDEVAQKILTQAAEELAQLAATTIGRLPRLPTPPTVFYSGGVFEAGSLLKEPFSRRLHRLVDEIRIRPPTFSPIVGSYLLALELCGVDLNAALVARLHENIRANDQLKLT